MARGMAGKRLALLGPMVRWLPAPVLLSSVLLVASCGEITEPEGFSVPPSTTEPGAEGADNGANPQADEAEGLGQNPTNSFVPRPPAGYVPTVLIGTSEAVLSAGPDGLSPLAGAFGDLGALRVVDDLLGGVVVQEGGAAGEVLWYPASGEEPLVIDDRGADLLDVGFSDGSAYAVVLVDDISVESVRLVDNVRTELLTLDEEEEVLGLSASGGLQALVVSDDRCGSLRFLSAAGALVELAGPVSPACPVPRRPAFGAVALSPDAGAVVYTDVSYRDDGIEIATDLVAIDLGTAGEFFRAQIGADGEQITALSFDGSRVAYLTQAGDGSSVTIVDFVGGSQTIPLAGTEGSEIDSISFARNPVSGTGVSAQGDDDQTSVTESVTPTTASS